ncbi:MAG: hypothetical protein Tsb0013_17130 [Phycisphaerales bacterium]
MLRLTRLLASTRLVPLLFLVPPAAMWARGEHTGGFLLPTALALFACAHLAIFDTKTLGAGRRQRLGFTRHPDAGDRSITELWGTYCLALLALVVLILLFAAPRVGVFWLVLSLIALPLTGGIGSDAGPSIRRRRMLLCELADPFAMLLLPAWWIASRTVEFEATDAQGVVTLETMPVGLSAGAWTITWLCALAFAAYLLACQLRDRGEDLSEGQVTTPTLLGRGTASVLLMLLLVVMQIVAAGALTPAGGSFTWLVPGATAIGGMAALYAIATDADDAAPLILVLMQALLIVSFTV